MSATHAEPEDLTHAGEHDHVLPLRTHFVIFGALLGLLLLTIGAAYLDLGRLNFSVAMLIAATKAGLIMAYFMHLRFSSRLSWVFATAAFFFLAILIGLSLSDYLSRQWLDIPGK